MVSTLVSDIQQHLSSIPIFKEVCQASTESDFQWRITRDLHRFYVIE